ncbi:Hypothetical predicted protein [Paramuricea clavata]|uniref:Uncharacterized protein n=1 Tax=Paramuricea clavata TaxID=317549 RepID=A0A6S7JE72_PARCT|nr:Hypothetical predicted protein [Paramuricea clavata]
MAEAKALSEAKLRRRTAKAALTRIIVKHEEYAQNIENDEEFETEEKWLEESQDAYLQLECTTNDYIINKNMQQTLGGSVEQPEASSGNNGSEAQTKLNSRKQSGKLRQLNSKL